MAIPKLQSKIETYQSYAGRMLSQSTELQQRAATARSAGDEARAARLMKGSAVYFRAYKSWDFKALQLKCLDAFLSIVAGVRSGTLEIKIVKAPPSGVRAA